MRSHGAIPLTAVLLLSGCGGGGCDLRAGTQLMGSQCTADSGPIAQLPPSTTFRKSGNGPSVFVLPDVDLITVTATSASLDNFVVYLNEQTIINEIIGACSALPTYSGTFAAKPGGLVHITLGATVQWTVTGGKLPLQP
jgi:hypothetical protein